MSEYDLDRLDDSEWIESHDPQGMLRAVATSGAQVRASLTATREASLGALALEDRPRALVVAGMGGSGISGDVLAAITGTACPVPVIVHRDYGLPGWVGAADLVLAVSCSGSTAETLSATAEAARRNARLLGVGAAGSELESICLRGHGSFVPVVKQLSPRSSLWALVVPLLLVGSKLGLVDLGSDDEALEVTAVALELTADLCGPDRESFTNPAKTLAAELAGSLPMIWGTGPTGGVAALRAACQVAENAKQPAVAGQLPESHHNQVVTFDGPLAGGRSDDDLFRDRLHEQEPTRLRLWLLRDDDNDEVAKKRAHVSADVAAARGIAVSVLGAQGRSSIERLASMVGIIDFASVYLGLAYGLDPTPIGPIDELKRALSEPRTLEA